MEELQTEFQSFAEDDYQEIERLLKSFYADAKAVAPRSWVEFDQRFRDVAVHSTIKSLDRGQERICFLLEKYQEQSELLDPHLEFFTCSLMGFLRVHLRVRNGGLGDSGAPAEEKSCTGGEASIHVSFKVIYMLCKVRGYKTISKFFPHEVSDLEQTWNFLRRQDRGDFRRWETRYCLFLWLAIIALIPFNLATVDSTAVDSSSSPSTSPPHTPNSPSSLPSSSPEVVIAGNSLLARMINLAITYLSDTGAVREAAAIFIARLFSRSDIFASHNDLVAQFFEWAHRVSESSESDVFTKVGSLYCICCTLKKAPRSFMMQYLEGIFAIVTQKEQWSESNNILVRKLAMKIVQRVALTLLPPRVAKWRYKRGFRSLEKNLQLAPAAEAQAEAGAAVEGEQKNTGLSIDTSILSSGFCDAKNSDDEAGVDSDEEFEVDVLVESIIGELLDGLRDRDTVVRWSAAKGVGRLTMRLPLDMGDEVVASVLTMFEEGELDGAWHGGCLALAELARRGLLLPDRLDEVIPLTMQALLYDVRMGLHSIGSHVRDAACYLCWAFARAFAPEVMQPYVGQLARGLLTLAVYDREVNVRRAASAAFQENVGRQGIFPHGIDINTTADYFALGKRAHAYLEIGYFIAQYDEYKFHLVDHLAKVKSKHWDVNVRELTAKTMAKLVAREGVAAHVELELLPLLIANCLSPDLFTRHGACLAVGRVLIAMHETGYEMQNKGDKGALRAVVRLVPGMEETGMFNSSGGQRMREAACAMVHRISRTRLVLSAAEVASFQHCIHQGLHHPHTSVVSAAAAAMKSFGRVYYPTFTQEIHAELTDGLLKHLGHDKLPEGTRGVALALGLLPSPLLLGTSRAVEGRPDVQASLVLTSVVCGLLQAADIKQQRDTETRRNAIKSLVEVVRTLGAHASTHLVSLTPALRHFAPPDSKADSGLVVEVVCEALLAGVCDYSADKRGDVGSWVREEAMRGMHDLLLRSRAVDGAEAGVLELSKELVARSMGALAKQMVEKINKVRGVAGELFEAVVSCALPDVPHLPHHRELKQLVVDLEAKAVAALPAEVANLQPEVHVSHIGWSTPELLEELLPRLLALQSYTYPVMDGMVLSVGGLTESIVRFSSAGLLEYLGAFQEDEDEDAGNAGLVHAFEVMLQLMQGRDARVIIPVFKTFELLFNNCIFDLLPTEAQEGLGLRLHAAVLQEIRGCKDITKIMAAVGVLVGLVAFPGVCTKSLHTVLLLLVHGFPKVRRVASTKFYTALTTGLELDELGVDAADVKQVSDSLKSFPWDKQGQIEATRAERNNMYPLLRLEVPAKVKAKAAVRKPKAAAGKYEGGYGDFVRELNFS